MSEKIAVPVDMPVATVSDGMKPSVAGKEFEDEWPGHLKLANERGHYFGCASAVIPADRLNDFFKDNENHLIVEVQPLHSRFGVERVLVVWSKTMSDTEVQEMQEVQAEVTAVINKRKADRAEAKEKAAEAEEKAKAERKKEAEAELDELKRLAQVARKTAKRDSLVKLLLKQGDLLSKFVEAWHDDSDIEPLVAEVQKLGQETNDAAQGK